MTTSMDIPYTRSDDIGRMRKSGGLHTYVMIAMRTAANTDSKEVVHVDISKEGSIYGI